MSTRILIPLLHVALLAAVAPALARPFFWPKLAVLCAGTLAALALPAARARAMTILPIAWILLAALSALAHPGALEPVLLDGAAALLLYALLSRRWDVSFALRAIALAGCAEAAVVLAQLYLHGEGRMALFGTLGNPDFAAAWLGASLCLALGERLHAAAAFQLLALAALGSFASVLALAAALIFALPRRALAAGALALLCAGAAGRDLKDRVAGRAYLHRVATPHLADNPLLGGGPGSLRARWPAWEIDRFASGSEPIESRRYAAPQEHAHDDYLERALEQGLPAALLIAALAALSILRGRSHRPWAAGALASLAARALVDFPLARPAELALFVTLAAACLEKPCRDSPSPSP
jgi:putative inorganic carbon (HCO3(-)) transporter